MVFSVNVPPKQDPEAEDSEDSKDIGFEERPIPFSLAETEAADPHRDRTLEIGNSLRNSELALNLNPLLLTLTLGLWLALEPLLLSGRLEWFARFAACISIGARADFLPFRFSPFCLHDGERGIKGGGSARASKTSRGEYNLVGTTVVVVGVRVGVSCCSTPNVTPLYFESSSPPSSCLGGGVGGREPSSDSCSSASG